MELTPLKSFLVLAREGRVTRAAARLHLTQPAVSAQLARLEEELGQRLFHRTPKGMVLTEAGRVLRRFAEDALGRLEDGRRAVAELGRLERGRLSVGGGATATTYLLPGLLARFHAQHPGLQLFVREQGSRGVQEAVRSGELDLGLVTVPALVSRGADGAALQGLAVEPWVQDELRLVVPSSHPLHGRDSFRWRDLHGAPLVLFEAGTAVRDLIDAHLQRSGVRVHIVMELRSIASIQQMVGQGIGAGFVSRHALPTPGAGLRCADGPLARELAIIYRSDRALEPAAAAFRDLLRAEGPHL